MICDIDVYRSKNKCTKKTQTIQNTHTHTLTHTLIILGMNSTTDHLFFGRYPIQPCRRHVYLCHSETYHIPASAQPGVRDAQRRFRHCSTMFWIWIKPKSNGKGWNRYKGLPSFLPYIRHHSSRFAHTSEMIGKDVLLLQEIGC